MKIKKRILIPVVFLCITLIWALSDPYNTQFKAVEECEILRSQKIVEVNDNPQTIKAMTWNIKFGGGRLDFFFECHGDRVIMQQHEVERHLNKICAFIDSVNPDILFLQEVDRKSKRVSGIDQLQYILDNTSLNYATYGSQWKADLIPRNGLGNIESGNAILSKYPFTKASRVALPMRPDQDPLTRYFYLKRSMLHSAVSIHGKEIELVNTHLSAFDKGNTRKAQVDSLTSYVRRLSPDKNLLFGGDFNLIPPVASQRSGFDDCACEDDSVTKNFNGKEGLLAHFYDEFQPAVSLSELKQSDKEYFTHTTKKNGYWNRKLDYLFSTKGLIRPQSAITYQDSLFTNLSMMQLSDHAPISVELALESFQ